MANNYIEEFLIGIGFDTKKVKGEAKEIDTILNGLVKKGNTTERGDIQKYKKRRKRHKQEVSDKQKAQRLNDSLLKGQFKLEEKLSKKANKVTKVKVAKKGKNTYSSKQLGQRLNDNILKNQFKLANAPVKAVKEVKVAKEVEKVKDKSQQKRQNKRKKHRAALARKRLSEENKANQQAKKNLQARLRLYKSSEGAQAKRLHKKMTGSNTFNQARGSGKFAAISRNMDAARAEGKVGALRKLQFELRKAATETRKLNMAQKSLADSTRNMIRSYASVFALFQGTVAIKRVGQEFEGMRSSMLAASGSAPAAAKDMAFINDMSEKMGLNLKDTTDAFVKFKFAAKGKMDNSEIEDLFESVSMFGTALKVAPEDMKRAQRALSQMMSKGVVMSEELKMQLGDALPGAVQVFAKALGITEAQLFKQMEQGKVIASEVLPKVANAYREAAMAGGAYELALKGLRVTEGRMIKGAQEAGDKVFQSGFSAGLSDLYETISKLFKESGPQLRKLGQIFGTAFRGIARALELITPVLSFVIDHFGALLGTYMVARVGIMVTAISKMTAAMKLFGATSAASWAVALAPITALITSFGLIDDWLAKYDRHTINSDEAARGYQIVDGERVGIEKREGKWYDTGKVLDNEGESYWMSQMVSNMLGDSAAPSNTKTTHIGKVELNVNGASGDTISEIQSFVDNGFAPTSG